MKEKANEKLKIEMKIEAAKKIYDELLENTKTTGDRVLSLDAQLSRARLARTLAVRQDSDEAFDLEGKVSAGANE